MKKKIILIIVSAVVMTAVWWHFYRSGTGFPGKGPAEAPVGTKDKAALEQKILAFSIDGRSPKGAKQWHLDGDSAEIVGEDIHLNDLTAVVYGENVVINLTSDKGIYRRDKGEVELIGNVHVVSDDGFTLDTDKARWLQATKEIDTDSLVHIRKEGMSAVGQGGMANSDERRAVLNKNVNVTIEPDTKVDCDGSLEVDYNHNLAVFRDNVRVEDKDGKMFADKLTVEFNPETQKLFQVTAEGNVKIKKGKSYTISEKAIYRDSTKSAQLLGNPRVLIDPDELSDLEGLGEKSAP
ncbi:MAG: LPS export ABC transporter periplasmic protein LptC [Candidatus Omnitrophota bacterium]